jgi:uncharacterized RDD family membrane protein YckC
VSVRTHPGRWVSAQGHYAGSVSRFAAYLIDLTVSSIVFSLALTLISFVAEIVTGKPVSWHRDNIVVVIIYVAWQFVYFGFQWAANGKTLGMSLLGVHVVRADGTRLEPWRGWVRSLTFPLGFLTLGLGFLGILVQREHRAVYDLIAGTAVVYAWDARAARLRFLARQAEPVADAASPLAHAGPVADAARPPAEPVTVTASPPAPAEPVAVTASPLAPAGPVEADGSDATQPIAVTADGPGPADPAGPDAGSDTLAGPGQEHPEPSSKGDAWPTSER